MEGFLRQSTATTLVLGPFVNSSTAAPENGLTISQADVRLSKNSGAFAQKNESTAATLMENGQYSCPINATDSNAAGGLRVAVYEAGALIWWGTWAVLNQNSYDSLFGADRLQVHVDEMTAGIITAATIATGAIDADAMASDAVSEIQNGLATAAALQVVDDLVDELETRLTAVRAGYLDNLSGGAAATAGALAAVAGYIDTEITTILAAVDTEIAAILAKVNNLPADPADDSDIDAQLAAIAGYLDTEVAAILAAVDTEIAAILAKVNNLPANPAAVGSAMTLAANAVNAAALAADAVAEMQAGLSTLTAGQVNAEVVDALSVDSYAEPGVVPGATSSLKDKIGWLFMMARNKRVTTSNQDRVRNDADTADVGTATLNEDGSAFTSGKFS
ncbi:protein of unknown function [Candidatus Promineifilum breve]|uniref:Uncharacterized protein n=1 Tax=Candidatus Promineifilum breve TaxID=1806508 RepID=A0A160T538_9CHLR|nr:hypothetical protein [Candidatus Promineifilum breve]CUS04248.2 protein of unknown function [Candidatus Promineifilum breve]